MMPLRLLSPLHPARLDAYREECARIAGVPAASVTAEQIAALYMWQTALGAAWFENLAYTEAILRHATDTALRAWNLSRTGSEDWLRKPDPKLRTLVKKAATDAERQAETARKRRPPSHPRKNNSVNLDDLVAQLSFGNIVHLMPVEPPTKRASLRSGYTSRENLWRTGVAQGFSKLTPDMAKRWVTTLPPDVPSDVLAGYAIGQALERLGRLRNRIGHHEQILTVNHSRLRKDVTLLLRSVSPGASDALKRIDRVPRVLAMKPMA